MTGGGGVKIRKKKRYVIVERPLKCMSESSEVNVGIKSSECRNQVKCMSESSEVHV